jgi:hypothetical protein
MDNSFILFGWYCCHATTSKDMCCCPWTSQLWSIRDRISDQYWPLSPQPKPMASYPQTIMSVLSQIMLELLLNAVSDWHCIGCQEVPRVMASPWSKWAKIYLSLSLLVLMIQHRTLTMRPNQLCVLVEYKDTAWELHSSGRKVLEWDMTSLGIHVLDCKSSHNAALQEWHGLILEMETKTQTW